GHVHGNDRLGARRDGRLQERDIHAEIVLAIDELRYRPGIGNRADRRNERIGRGDDLVTGSDAERLQRQAKALGPRAHPECELHADGVCKSRFELAYGLAEREITGRNHLPQTREDWFWISELLGQV